MSECGNTAFLHELSVPNSKHSEVSMVENHLLNTDPLP